jgi:6-pyruvoyltetrahydropterin/6-carboxytetrahydropterin synthase
MYKLARQIRFAINPFSDLMQQGANSYCAKPTAQGLSLFFALWVELTGDTNKDTGFVVNVSDIDRIVRDKAVGIFDEYVKNCLAPTPAVGGYNFEQIGQLLSRVWKTIENDFQPAKIDSLTVELMPVRKLAIKENGGNMLYISEKFEFAASHTLWNEKFSDDENYKVFGKCANPSGHGHNYIVEVTIKKSLAPAPEFTLAQAGGGGSVSPDPCGRGSEPGAKATGGSTLNTGAFENIVEKEFIRLVDHKNLNADVGYFKKVNPTVENIAEFAFKSLADKLKPLELDCITVWENDRTFCSYKKD